jgi:uncharacterized membrane protein YbhN (UPF0104 family)
MTRLRAAALTYWQRGAAHRLQIALLACALLAAGGIAVALPLDRDSSADYATAISAAVGWLSTLLSVLSWPVVGALVAVCAVHYAAAAVASRAAAGARLPWRQLLAVQLTASAANRLTPAGLGGAGVIGRFLMRRGGLASAQAAASVTALAVLGGLADVGAFGLMVGAGLVFGLAGAQAEVPVLLSRLTSLVPLTGTVSRVVAASGFIVVAAIAAVPTVRRSRLARRLRDGAVGYGRVVATLMRHPARVAALMGASAMTTLTLAAGFALAAVVGPANLPAGAVGALMIGYMVASAAGNALPVPGGIGTADAALVAVLLAAGATAGPALATVVAFRLVTFWAPAVVGAFAARSLRRAGAL